MAKAQYGLRKTHGKLKGSHVIIDIPVKFVIKTPIVEEDQVAKCFYTINEM